MPKYTLILFAAAVLLFALTGCSDDPTDWNDEYGVVVDGVDEFGKPTLGTTDWEEPAGKSDAMQGRPGLPTSVDDSPMAVWEVNNAWEDTNTPAARRAGMAWEADSGLTWEEKFHHWVASLERIERDGHGDTFMVTTPYGVELPAPSLECAEVAMFLRIAFASWFELPFFMEATDGNGARLYFGHFGIRTANGRYGNMPNFRTQYRDHSNLAEAIAAGQAQWPTDSTLAGRKLWGSFDDSQPMIGPDAHTGAYFDALFLNKRVGYFLMLQLTYFGSINLADPVNTYHVNPEHLRPSDTLIHRWQRTGIGHVMVVTRVERLGEGSTLQLEAQVASGSMPRRQPLWEDPASAKRNFTNTSAGGPGYAEFNGGLKRWRTAAVVNGRWTNIVPEFLAGEYLPATARDRIAERPGRFDDLLTELDPLDQLDALADIVERNRAHLRNYPSSCAARNRREDAFDDLYALGQSLGMDRDELDAQYRKLEDYVFAQLDYGSSKTCCWNSTTNDMYNLVMDYNRDLIDAAGTEACVEPVVFKARDDGEDGFDLFREYAQSVGLGYLWVTWSADESCPQANVTADTEIDHRWTPWCELSGLDDGSGLGDITTHSFTNDTLYDIPDNDPTGVSSAIEVDLSGTVEAVRIDVDITHTWRGDLVLYLLRDGERVEAYRASGSEDDLHLSGEYVSGFEGLEAAATWELLVVDTMARDTGTLNEWTLHLDID